MNALRAPEGIGEGHGADELGDLRIDGRTTGSTAPRLPVPERAEALPVPANHGLRLNDMERLAPPCPPLRATARRRGRGDRPEVAWSGGGAGRAAVAAPGSQERGRCGPSAQRAECPAERVRGTLLRRLASPATHVQRGDRYFGKRQRHFRPLPIAQGRIEDDSSRGRALFLVVSIGDDPLGRSRKAKVAGSNPVFRLRFGPADLAGLRVPGQELVRPCARSC